MGMRCRWCSKSTRSSAAGHRGATADPGLLAAAKSSIVVQVMVLAAHDRSGQAWLTLDGALRQAAARGVRVRLLVSEWALRSEPPSACPTPCAHRASAFGRHSHRACASPHPAVVGRRDSSLATFSRVALARQFFDLVVDGPGAGLARLQQLGRALLLKSNVATSAWSKDAGRTSLHTGHPARHLNRVHRACSSSSARNWIQPLAGSSRGRLLHETEPAVAARGCWIAAAGVSRRLYVCAAVGQPILASAMIYRGFVQRAAAGGLVVAVGFGKLCSVPFLRGDLDFFEHDFAGRGGVKLRLTLP